MGRRGTRVVGLGWMTGVTGRWWWLTVPNCRYDLPFSSHSIRWLLSSRNWYVEVAAVTAPPPGGSGGLTVVVVDDMPEVVQNRSNGDLGGVSNMLLSSSSSSSS